MFVHDRLNQISSRLKRRPRWTVTQLQKEMRVSRSTLRRDLLELEGRGDLVRVHGGVVHRDYLHGEPTFDRRGREAVAAKRLIGAVAAEMVADNATVYLDAGTTCFEVGRLLLLRSNIKILTHSLRFALEATNSASAASVILIGGEVRAVSQAVVGGLGLSWLDRIRADIAFLAASGVSSDGLFTTELSEAAMKQSILNRVDSAVLVADASKAASTAAVQFAIWREVDHWVIDTAIPRPLRAAVETAGTRIRICN